MKLNKVIKLNGTYARSINLERDFNTESLIKSYIPTSIALRTLKKIQFALNPKVQLNRSWTLIGPYGSGKSSFGLFLSSLLSNPNSKSFSISHRKLKLIDKSASNKIHTFTKNSKGYLNLLISGTNESIKKRLLKSLLGLIKQLKLSDSQNKELKKIEEKDIEKDINQKDVLLVLNLLEKISLDNGYSGILLIIDELGKFLEFEVAKREQNDLHLLQIIAEHSRKPVNNIIFLGFLHQSFQHYSKSLSESLKNEWTKIQGRFEEIPFVDSTEQTLQVISNCFEFKGTKKLKSSLEKRINEISFELKKNYITKYKNDALFETLKKCYPLHPLTSIILPILSQKVAQNERTIFSFINGQQDNSLPNLIENLDQDKMIRPSHIYDYFISNQVSIISDSITYRRWLEVAESIEKVDDLNHLELLKTIGLMNIVGTNSGLKPSFDVLKTLDFHNLKGLINDLSSKSVIKFRKYSNDYRIWEGSDFDLETELSSERSKILNFSLVDEIYDNFEVRPIVARKFSIDKGTVKSFDIKFVDSKNYKTIKADYLNPKIIFFVSFGKDDENLFYKDVINFFKSPNIVTLFDGSEELQDLLQDKLCLQTISKRKELITDRVAFREFDDQLSQTNKQLETIFINFYNSPQKYKWFFESKQLDIKNKLYFQKTLSKVLSKIYFKMPTLKNEIINKDYLSPQAVAARNKLIFLMFDMNEFHNLGIEKHPPEKSIYYTLLKNTGIHVCEKNKWILRKPQGLDENLLHVWNEIEHYFLSLSENAESIIPLNEKLMNPPYGIKAGVLPILIIAYYIVNKNDIAVYHSRKYVPFFDTELIERFVKRPDEFTFQCLDNSDSTKRLYKAYGAVFLKGNVLKPKVLDIAKPMAKLMNNLEYYTKNTEALSREAVELRSSFYFAKTPQDFLNKEIPKILNFNYEHLKKQSDFNEFEKKVANTFSELKNCYEELISYFKELIEEKFLDSKKSTLKDMRNELRARYDHLWTFSIDNEGVKNFIGKIALKNSDIKSWFLNLLMSLNHKPVDKWTDLDKENAEFKIKEFARKIIDLRTLKLAHDKYDLKEKKENDVYLFKLKSIKPQKDYNEEILLIEQKEFRVLNQFKDKILKNFNSQNDYQMILKALALVSQEVIESKNKKSQNKKEKDSIKKIRKL